LRCPLLKVGNLMMPLRTDCDVAHFVYVVSRVLYITTVHSAKIPVESIPLIGGPGKLDLVDEWMDAEEIMKEE
jgi:hypothetical protein